MKGKRFFNGQSGASKVGVVFSWHGREKDIFILELA